MWLALAILSAAYVAWDQFAGNPESTVMKWGFVLVTLYMGPLGLLLYITDEEPRPGKREVFIKPLWKQGVGSTVHCVAGDATGIILAAVVVAVIGLPMWLDLIVEYTAGFLLGLLIFQALFMRKMMGGTYRQNLRRSFLPEWISMNCMMAGMAPVMVALMMGRDMRAMWRGEPLFWVVMSLGVIVGFGLAYPVNVWMVARGMKHGLMTERGSSKNASDAPKKTSGSSRKARSAKQQHGHGGQERAEGGAAATAMTSYLTRPQLVAVTSFTMLMLLLGMSFPAAFYNLTLSAHDVRGAIMPPGMIMDYDTPAAAMLGMAAVDPRYVTKTAGLDVRGGRELAPRLENGVKVFDLETSVI